MADLLAGWLVIVSWLLAGWLAAWLAGWLLWLLLVALAC